MIQADKNYQGRNISRT